MPTKHGDFSSQSFVSFQLVYVLVTCCPFFGIKANWLLVSGSVSPFF